MGHKRCEKFTKPLNVEEMTDDVKAKFSDAYNWKDFESINHDLIPQFRSVFNANATAKQFYVLDVSMFEMRADGHIDKNDCLHYCTPSGINEWNKVLYHMLMQINRTEKAM